ELGAAGFVEEALEHDDRLRGQHAQRGFRAGEVVEQLLRGGFVQTEFVVQPCECPGFTPLSLRERGRGRGYGARRIFWHDRTLSPGPSPGGGGEQGVELFAQPRYRERELVRAPRRLAQPERDTGRHTVRIFHAQAIALHAQDAVAGVAELEDVAGETLDREVLVHR